MQSTGGTALGLSLMELAGSATPQGRRVSPPESSCDLDKQGRDLVVSWGETAGITITLGRDRQRVRCAARAQRRAPAHRLQRHIDTQPTGGKFDGNYGVLAGQGPVRLSDAASRPGPLEVIFWTNEEGSRFVPVMMGSEVFGKRLLPQDPCIPQGRRRQDGERGARAHRLRGHRGAGQKRPMGAYRGATSNETGARRCRQDHRRGHRRARAPLVRLRGEGLWRAHAGPATPMALRKDALQVATRIMQETVAIAHRYPPYGRGCGPRKCRCTPTAAT